MPTVWRFGGYRVVIFTNDHRPEHVHVIGNGSEAVFNLGCPDGPVTLRENHGFSRNEVNRIADELTPQIAALCAAWREIHG